jgi:transcription elongation factor GreA
MELPIVRRLKREVEILYHELNVRIPKDLQEAAAHGDLSENAEYEAARARQDFVRARIAQFEERLRQVSLYNLSSIPRELVAYGSRVKLEDVEEGQTIEYHIVFPEEVDGAAGAISLHSPIGQALLRKAVGDEVEVVLPGGKRRYEIVELITLHDVVAKEEETK